MKICMPHSDEFFDLWTTVGSAATVLSVRCWLIGVMHMRSMNISCINTLFMGEIGLLAISLTPFAMLKTQVTHYSLLFLTRASSDFRNATFAWQPFCPVPSPE
jgi:hypothetical protein